jgi:hypothetical protein
MIPDIVPAIDLRDDPAETLVKDLVPRTGVGFWWAESHTGKTLGLIHMALSITSGNPFMWHEVKQGQVAYMNGEGQQDFPQRIEAAVRWSTPDDSVMGRPYSERHLWVAQGAWSLASPDNVTQCIAQLRPIGRGDGELPLRMVIFDTLQRFSSGTVIRWQDKAAGVMMAAERISKELDCLVLFANHPKVPGSKEMLGGANFFNMADWVARQEGDKEGGLLTIEKNKGLPPADPLKYALEQAAWNHPETGALIKSVYMRPKVPPAVEARLREATTQKRAIIREVQMMYLDWMDAHPEAGAEVMRDMLVTSGHKPDEAWDIADRLYKGRAMITESAREAERKAARRQAAIAGR